MPDIPQVDPATPEDVAERYRTALTQSASKLLDAITETATIELKMLDLRGQPGADDERHAAAIKFRRQQAKMEDVILRHIRLFQDFLRHIDKMKGEKT